MSLLTTPAILLRSYPYSETSQTLRFYTEAHGVVGAIARGVRKASGRWGGSLSTFSEGILNIQFRENRDLQTFRDYSPLKTRAGLAKDPLRLAGASVLGELILKHAESAGHPALFSDLGRGLDAMEGEEMDGLLTTLLVQLWSLIQGLGFGPLIHECVECGRAFQGDEMGRFDFPAGGLRCSSCPSDVGGPRLGPVARAQLKGLMDGEAPRELILPRAHLRLASDFITYHISGGTPLRSFAVLATLISGTDA
ncbi:MAG: DNA repair protein RecO [Gemmatimonadales bacterium]|nr:MAG: DNA repair protein RecO [Gemmatimonadales bacterium]